MQEAQYDFLHGQTDRSDFFSPAMQQLCGIMKDNQVALPSDIGEDISAIFHRAPISRCTSAM